MKYLICSDIHGSSYFCCKLIEAFKAEKADKLIILGDILYHGPRNDLPREYAPKQVIAYLNPLKKKIICVRGNCEAEVDQMVLEFPCMADYGILQAGDRTIYLSHGHIFNEKNLPPLSDGDILINGHTHVPKCTEHKNYVYMNPGSVSIPKEESCHGYMTFDGETFLWKDLLTGQDFMEYKL